MTINNSFYSDIIAGILFQIHIIKYSYFQFFLTILCLMVVGSAVVMVDGMEDHSLYGPWHPILVHPEADQCHLEYFSRFPSRFRTSVILMREINRWTTLNLLCHRHTLFRRIFFFRRNFWHRKQRKSCQIEPWRIKSHRTWLWIA